MTKVMFVLHKRSGMSWQEFQRYWKETHAPIVAKLPGLRGYIQNQVLPDLSQADPPFSGISEHYYDNVESMQAALASPEGVAADADALNFLDNDKTGMIVVEEVTIV